MVENKGALHDFVNTKRLRESLKRTKNGDRTQEKYINRLLLFEIWMREVINGGQSQGVALTQQQIADQLHQS